MAAVNHQLFVFDNGRKIKDTKKLEILTKAIAVSADEGVTNILTISEGAGANANKFDFGGKVIGNVGTPTANGQVLIYNMLGANSGIATLDSGGKVPASQLPNSVMEYKGTYDPTANSGVGVPPLANSGMDPAPSAGDVYKVTAAASHDFGAGALSMVIGDYVIYSGTVWEVSHSGADAVISVNGKSGAVSLNTDDISEGTANLYFSGKNTDQLTEGTANLYFSGKNTDQLTEGSTNLYFASGFAAATTDGLTEGTSNLYFSGKNTDQLTEGTVNLYFSGKNTDQLTEGTVNLYFSGKNTDQLTEGTGNLYFASGFAAATTDGLTEGTGNLYFASGFAAATTDGLTEGTANLYFSGKTTDDLPEGTVNKYFTGVNNFAAFVNKDVDAITAGQFVKMTTAGEVTKLTSADSVGDESFFACAKDATVAADGTANFYLPEMGARISGYTSLDVTKLVYAHATVAGSYTQTRPTTGKVIILGKPISATEIIFLGRFEAEYV